MSWTYTFVVKLHFGSYRFEKLESCLSRMRVRLGRSDDDNYSGLSGKVADSYITFTK